MAAGEEERTVTQPTRILLVEDDEALALEITRELRRAGWQVDHMPCLADAAEALLQRGYRTLLLDRTLPDGDGIGLVPLARTREPPPVVIILSARDEVADRVAGLDAGADDYLSKPFAMQELLARLRATGRRPRSIAIAPPIALGDLRFEPATGGVTIRGKARAIPRRELDLLQLLIERCGRVVRREFLESELFGFSEAYSSNALETQVSRLRRRLADLDARVEIRSVRGVGYLMQSC
jgi:two-component system OmpR family response regulator